MNAIESRRMRSKGQSGFTLIELLVVIAILGVLAGVVVFAVGGVSDTAKEKACQTEKKTTETALEAYKADLGAYPTTLAGLGALAPTYVKTSPAGNFNYASVAAVAGPPAVAATYTLAVNPAGDYPSC
jgi:type II secretion system protein G